MTPFRADAREAYGSLLTQPGQPPMTSRQASSDEAASGRMDLASSPCDSDDCSPPVYRSVASVPRPSTRERVSSALHPVATHAAAAPKLVAPPPATPIVCEEVPSELFASDGESSSDEDDPTAAEAEAGGDDVDALMQIWSSLKLETGELRYHVDASTLQLERLRATNASFEELLQPLSSSVSSPSAVVSTGRTAVAPRPRPERMMGSERVAVDDVVYRSLGGEDEDSDDPGSVQYRSLMCEEVGADGGSAQELAALPPFDSDTADLTDAARTTRVAAAATEAASYTPSALASTTKDGQRHDDRSRAATSSGESHHLAALSAAGLKRERPGALDLMPEVLHPSKQSSSSSLRSSPSAEQSQEHTQIAKLHTLIAAERAERAALLLKFHENEALLQKLRDTNHQLASQVEELKRSSGQELLFGRAV